MECLCKTGEKQLESVVDLSACKRSN